MKQLPTGMPFHVATSYIQSQYQLPDLFYLDLWPFSDPFIVTGDLLVANQFLNDYTRHPMLLQKGLQPLVGGARGVVSNDISEWHNSRTTIRTAFSVGNVRNFVPKMAHYSMELRAALLQRATIGRRFPLIDPIEKWGADLTFHFLLGEDTAVQRGGRGAKVNEYIQRLILHADNQLAMNPYTNYKRKKERGLCHDRIREMIRPALINAIERLQLDSEDQFVSLVDTLVAKYKEEYPGRTKWDDDTLVQHLDTVTTMLLAADVSSMVLTVAFPFALLHILTILADSFSTYFVISPKIRP
jgi:hypothetical protein